MCLTSTKYGVNPMIPHKDDRPKCSIEGCDNTKAIMGCLKDGRPKYRKICEAHHSKNTAAAHGFNSIGELTANRKGFDTPTAYKNSYHPYRRYRKDYCENVDSRLGFECTTTIHWEGMLDVDHINGIPNDNRLENLQTLCKCCHFYKGNIFKDYKTPGRKALGMAC